MKFKFSENIKKNKKKHNFLIMSNLKSTINTQENKYNVLNYKVVVHNVKQTKLDFCMLKVSYMRGY